MLRERHRIGRGFAEIRAEIVNAERRRTATGHQRVAGRRTDGLVAIRALEDDAASSESLKVGRLDRLVAVAAEHRLEVIDADQEDVGLFGGARWDAWDECDQCGEE